MKKGFTIVEVMVVTAIIAVLAVIALPNLGRNRVNANEAKAQATLKIIAGACELYASRSNSKYPQDYGFLINATPAYINDNYTNRTFSGYNFTCTMSPSSGYTCDAIPEVLNRTGTRCFRSTTGQILSNFTCS